MVSDADPDFTAKPQFVDLDADQCTVPESSSSEESVALAARTRHFDFRRPNKLSRDHVRNLHIIHETFARQFSTVLSSTLRAVSNVSVMSIDQLTYDEYIRETPNPSHLSLLSIAPLPGAAILQLPLPTALAIVDVLLGGPGGASAADRPLTEIEKGLIRTLIDRALEELTYAFETTTSIEPRVLRYESNPQFAQIAAPSDMTVAIIFEIQIGAAKNRASLCFPYTALQPILDTIASTSAHATIGRVDLERARERLTGRLLDVPVDMVVEFAPISLTTREIVALEVGDVVSLGQAVDAALPARVGGQRTFLVRPAHSGKRVACQIVRRLTASTAPATPERGTPAA